MLADACALRALLPQVVPGRQVGQAGAAGGGRLQGQVDRPGPHSEPIHHSSGLLCRQLAAWLLGKVRRQTIVVCSCASEEQRLGSARAKTDHAWSRCRRAHDTMTAPLCRSSRRRQVRASVPLGCTAAGADPPAAMRRLLAAGAAA